jgi:hypothetical protein
MQLYTSEYSRVDRFVASTIDLKWTTKRDESPKLKKTNGHSVVIEKDNCKRLVLGFGVVGAVALDISRTCSW